MSEKGKNQAKAVINRAKRNKTAKDVELKMDRRILKKRVVEAGEITNPYAVYEDILDGKVTDKKLYDDVIKFREIMLRKRISVDCILKGAKEEMQIRLIGVLVEELQMLTNHWYGKEFRDSQSIRSYHDNIWVPVAITKGIKKSEVLRTPIVSPNNPFKITGITYTIKYA